MRNSRNRLLFGALLVVVPLGSAQAEDERWTPEAAAHLGGVHGLTGFGSMVDGRIPSPFLAQPQTAGPLGSHSSRVTLRYAYGLRSETLRGEQASYESRRHRHRLSASYGFTVQGIDVGLTVPFEQEYEALRQPGGPRDTDQSYGLGDVVVGVKAGFRIPKFWFGDWAVAGFAPYLLGRLPTGTSDLGEPAQIDGGIAVAGPYGYSFRWHGNLAVRHRSGGTTALVYRFGGSAVPVASETTVWRVHVHLSGVEFEGPPNSDVDLELGSQVLLGGFLTIDVGVAVRLVSSGFVDDQLQRRVREDFGDSIGTTDEQGTVAVTFGIGVVL